MNRNNHSVLSYLFILVALAYVLKLVGIITVSVSLIVAYAFMVYGLVSVYLTMGSHHRAGLFLGTAIFLTGIVLFITEYFTIISPSQLVFPSILFILGAAFLMLFLDDRLNRVFLYSSGVLIICSVLSILFVKRFAFLGLANRMAAGMLDYYPVFIILLGIYILINRKN